MRTVLLVYIARSQLDAGRVQRRAAEMRQNRRGATLYSMKKLVLCALLLVLVSPSAFGSQRHQHHQHHHLRHHLQHHLRHHSHAHHHHSV